jgi:hypothetical protein
MLPFSHFFFCFFSSLGPIPDHAATHQRWDCRQQLSQCRVDNTAWQAWAVCLVPDRQSDTPTSHSICMRVYNDPWLRQGSAPLPTSVSCRCQGVIGLQTT